MASSSNRRGGRDEYAPDFGEHFGYIPDFDEVEPGHEDEEAMELPNKDVGTPSSTRASNTMSTSTTTARAKRSKVWDHFDIEQQGTNNSFAVCKICKTRYSYKTGGGSGGTGTLKKHLVKATRKSSCCALCENPNLASICPICVNDRLNEYNCHLRLLKSKRDALYSKLTQVLVAKGKADDQHRWRVLQNEILTRLRDNLRLCKEKVSTGKAKMEKISHDLKVKYELLQSAKNTLEKSQVDQLEKYYPNLICKQKLKRMAITSERLRKQSIIIEQICKLFPQSRVNVEEESYDSICNARLPRGLDPHSVPSAELAASLGYMVHLINLLVRCICVPALHNSGFAGSCSRIWQRDSYWDARPSSRCVYPLFIPGQQFCSTGGDISWFEKSSSSFGLASMESERRPCLDSSGSNSFKYSSGFPHSVETHKDLQKGISLLKRSVACITAYCYNSLSLEVPQEVSTFEAFARFLYK
ncbi:uncharacterized protein [Primulina huaijiensis]|uniref:uncharacterized protein n=1 Tax=Primulina huaijiensis TaxID=1492673 RepID=UPI003CC731E5